MSRRWSASARHHAIRRLRHHDTMRKARELAKGEWRYDGHAISRQRAFTPDELHGVRGMRVISPREFSMTSRRGSQTWGEMTARARKQCPPQRREWLATIAITRVILAGYATKGFISLAQIGVYGDRCRWHGGVNIPDTMRCEVMMAEYSEEITGIAIDQGARASFSTISSAVMRRLMMAGDKASKIPAFISKRINFEIMITRLAAVNESATTARHRPPSCVHDRPRKILFVIHLRYNFTAPMAPRHTFTTYIASLPARALSRSFLFDVIIITSLSSRAFCQVYYFMRHKHDCRASPALAEFAVDGRHSHMILRISIDYYDFEDVEEAEIKSSRPLLIYLARLLARLTILVTFRYRAGRSCSLPDCRG